MSAKHIHESFQNELERYIGKEQTERFLEACRRPLKKSITINVQKLSLDRFLKLVQVWWWHLQQHTFIKDTYTCYIDRDDTSIALWNTFLHQSWFFYIQEIAASIPATQLELTWGELVLDIAAAPWGKTSQLANLLLKTWTPWLVVANDVAGPRVKTLAHNLNKWWCYNTALTKFNWFAFGKNLPEFFDHVLVDAPCSWEGTWFKSDHAMKYRKKEEINKIAGTQFQLLVSAIKTAKPGWTIIYSTCTINPYENEEILARIQEFFGDSLVLESVELLNHETGIAVPDSDYESIDSSKVGRFRPHIQKTWWFFVSKLRKVTSVVDEKKKYRDHKLLPKNQFKLDISKWLQKKVAKRLKETFGIEVTQSEHWFIATKDVAYLTSPTFLKIQPHLHCEKAWIPILKQDRLNTFRPTHFLWNILGHLATKNTLQFTDEQMQRYSAWENIPLVEAADTNWTWTTPYRIIKWNEFGMSTTKMVKWEWKNKFGK